MSGIDFIATHLSPWVHLDFPVGHFFEGVKVIWHPNRGLSCNSRGVCTPEPKSNQHLDKPLFRSPNLIR